MVTRRNLVSLLAGIGFAVQSLPAMASQPGEQLAKLSRAYWQYNLESRPLDATFLGVHDYDDRLEDYTPLGRARYQARMAQFLKEANGIDRLKLSTSDQVTLDLFKDLLSNWLAVESACQSSLWNIDQLNGYQTRFPRIPVYQPITDQKQAEALLGRYQAIGAFVDADIANLRSGLAQGYRAPRVAVERVIPQVEMLLAEPVMSSSFTRVSLPADWTETQTTAYRQQLTRVVTEVVYPAFQRYAMFLQQDYLPRSRTEVGVSANKNGLACYRASIRSQTSKDLTPEQVHALGLSEMARIQVQMRQLTRKIFGTEDLKAVLTKLRSEPQYAFQTPEEVEAFARATVKRAEARLPQAFGLLPKSPVQVEPVPSLQAKDSTMAYYEPPSIDGKRPGVYFVNTYAPTSRPRYVAEVLAFHEAVPGHHLQIAIANDLKGLPEFRKHEGTTAFVEGWGLYSEQVAEDLDLYSNDLSKLGKLSFDAWRAARLVVDSGMHAMKWDRQKALDYLYDNTALSQLDAENEIDRYIIWPGQALAYKVGQLEILSLRAEAQKRLGSKFDLRAFHDQVLQNGVVTMPVLRSQVTAWIEKTSAQTSR